jgi:hypothetical protein
MNSYTWRQRSFSNKRTAQPDPISEKHAELPDGEQIYRPDHSCPAVDEIVSPGDWIEVDNGPLSGRGIICAISEIELFGIPTYTISYVPEILIDICTETVEYRWVKHVKEILNINDELQRLFVANDDIIEVSENIPSHVDKPSIIKRIKRYDPTTDTVESPSTANSSSRTQETALSEYANNQK